MLSDWRAMNSNTGDLPLAHALNVVFPTSDCRLEARTFILANSKWPDATEHEIDAVNAAKLQRLNYARS